MAGILRHRIRKSRVDKRCMFMIDGDTCRRCERAAAYTWGDWHSESSRVYCDAHVRHILRYCPPSRRRMILAGLRRDNAIMREAKRKRKAASG